MDPPGNGQAGGAAALLAFALSLAACGGEADSPEAAVRAWVDDGIAAMEAEDRRALTEMVSPAYQDARGNDRKAIDAMLRYWFLRRDTIALITHIESLEVFGDDAAEVLMTVGAAGMGGGFSADAWRVALELERDGGDWRLISARWGDLGGELR